MPQRVVPSFWIPFLLYKINIWTSKCLSYLNLRSSEIHLFYNLGDFYWHFLEILWLFIFLFLYSLFHRYLLDRRFYLLKKLFSTTEKEQHQLLYLGFSIHQEVASDSFCFLINSSWLLVFILFLFLYALGLNLYCWKGIHFS